MAVHTEAIGVSAPPRPLRILVVDDDDATRALCAELLRRDGFEVLEADDGRDGIARAVSELPDLVLCDVNMPFLDGFRVAAALRGNEQTRDVPVVFLTGETDPEVETRAFDAGAHGFFRKPFAPGALLSFIRAALAPGAPAALGATGGRAS